MQICPLYPHCALPYYFQNNFQKFDFHFLQNQTFEKTHKWALARLIWKWINKVKKKGYMYKKST
jgi:hypothetical protein